MRALCSIVYAFMYARVPYSVYLDVQKYFTAVRGKWTSD